MTKHNDNSLSAIEKLITWSPKDKRFKLHYKVFTQVPVEQVSEYLIISEIKRSYEQIHNILNGNILGGKLK